MLLAKIIAVMLAIIALHNIPVWSKKYQARTKIQEKLKETFQDSTFEIRNLRDRSNYRKLFDLTALVPTGGNEEYWDICLTIKTGTPKGTRKNEFFRAVGDRKRDEINLYKASSFHKCLSDQAG